MEYEEKRRTNDIILDKGIDLLEENLKALNELKNRFNLNERDHTDVKETLAVITTNTFEILNRMNRATNDKIIELLETNEDTHIDFKYRWSEVYNITKALNDKLDGLGIIKQELDVIKGTAIQTKETFGLVQKVLFVILSILIFIQIITTAYRSKEDLDKADIKSIVERILDEE